MEAKSFLPKLPRILQAMNEMGIHLRLGTGWEWDKECDLSRPSLHLGDIFNFIVCCLRFRILCIQICGNLLQKEKSSNFVDIQWKVCCFDPVVSSGAVYEICSIRCTFFHCNIEIVNN